MLCPKCRTRTLVTDTRRHTQPIEPITVRLYRCPNPECGVRWKTEEWVKEYLGPSRKSKTETLDAGFVVSRET